MKILVSAFIGCFVLLLTYSCDKYSNEPRTIYDDVPLFLTDKAQARTIDVMMKGGKPYNGQVDWEIVSLYRDVPTYTDLYNHNPTGRYA